MQVNATSKELMAKLTLSLYGSYTEVDLIPFGPHLGRLKCKFQQDNALSYAFKSTKDSLKKKRLMLYLGRAIALT